MGFLKPDLFTRRCRAFRSADFSGVWFHWPLATDHWPLLLVRDHAPYFLKIRITHQYGISEFFLPLLGLRRQDVTSKGMMAHDLTAAGYLEPLGSSLMSLELYFDFRDLSQIYPPEDPCDPTGLADAGCGALGLVGGGGARLGWPSAGRWGAPPDLPAAFLGASIVVRFGPSSRGRASTCPASPTS